MFDKNLAVKFTILHKQKRIAVEKGNLVPKFHLCNRSMHIFSSAYIINKKRKDRIKMKLRKNLTILALVGACIFTVTVPLVSAATQKEDNIPTAFISTEPTDTTDIVTTENTSMPDTTENNTEPPSSDVPSELAVYIAEEDKTVMMALEDYIVCVLAAEMPYTFHTEALKAQAVAARSYCLHKLMNGNSHDNGADICTDYSHCAAYVSEGELVNKYGKTVTERILTKIKNAVKETEGQVITWKGEPALAVFHSSSYKKTESSKNIWGGDVPYLVSVSTPEEDRISTVTLTNEQISKLFSSQSVIKLDSASTKDGLHSIVNGSGRHDYICFNGTAVKAKLLRSDYGFRSLNFEYQKTANGYVFTVHGHGHGVGMSQYGANEMAKNGSLYDEILKHYYTGVDIQSVSDIRW